MRSATSAVKRALWHVPQIQTLYHRARARQTVAQLDLTDPDRLPILVYQMGKVGSQTVARSLDAIGLDRPVLDLPFMTPKRLECARDMHLAGTGGLPFDWCLGERLGPRLRALGPGLQIPVVTLVRDPIARLVADVATPPGSARPTVASDEPLDVDAALAHLERKAQRKDVWLGPDQWFDNELKEMFGIDVFALPFVKDLGYGIYRSSRARVLLLRMEDLDDMLGPALAEFLELPEPPKLIRANERKRLADREAYAEVKDRFRLSRERVDHIYAQRVPRHFYDDATLQRFTERWSR